MLRTLFATPISVLALMLAGAFSSFCLPPVPFAEAAIIPPPVTPTMYCQNGGTALYNHADASHKDINEIRTHLTGIFCLGEDIDLGAYTNWMPIGGANQNQFKGQLEGISCSNLSDKTTCKPHTIRTLTIKTASPGKLDYGLFGEIYKASIRNIGFLGVNIFLTGGSVAAVGGLVGVSLDSVIENSYVTGAINVSGGSVGGEIGGLVGQLAGGTIQKSFSTAAVTVSNGFAVGGLVGINFGDPGPSSVPSRFVLELILARSPA